MNIVIVGSGKVGFTLAEQLVREEHDVTVVDSDEEALQRAGDQLDIMTVRGNGVSSSTLREAGAADADLLVAATNSDEVNMVCCLTAKDLGAKYTIARIRNQEYTNSVAELRRNLKIDMVINPENTTAVEISRLLRFPAAANIETFCRGKVELMGFRLQEGDFLVGVPLYNLPAQVKKLSLLFCAVDRGGQVSIPNGSFVPQAEDKLYMVGRPDSLDQFFRQLGRYAPKVRQVFLVGGGKVSVYLAAILSRMNIRLKIVELSEERCRLLSERFPKVTVICGDGTDSELLESENLTGNDAFIALTDRDEDNLIISLYAMQQGLAKVITKCNRQNYAGIVRSLGLDSVISPKFVTASHILHVVRGLQNSQGSVMNSLHRIAGGGAEAMEFTVGPGTRHLQVPLKELRLRPGILLAVIVRGGDIIIPEGSSFLQQGDQVIIIARESGILDLNDIYGPEVNPGGSSL
ncbi:Trk system potassium transporter TrkA [Pseudoflavonifractor sp. 60]|uniref:Trk system potassium transporter TrkA n=1 Tax=Pseudoflavonifractor sp. 60 TaxID=2304576 RepID=UPI0013709E92|nr:Trk system potassium transporter TrkA [Pseudoflavonifractor sp. 60]NBI68065.1 Trk system potassium transporter TrkA [Pseudoflavonifractor sp. 60]